MIAMVGLRKVLLATEHIHFQSPGRRNNEQFDWRVAGLPKGHSPEPPSRTVAKRLGVVRFEALGF
jgi:hypothetical protein